MKGDEQSEMVRELVATFVRRELMPLENDYLARRARGIEPPITTEQSAHLNAVSSQLGLWGLDAPVEMGGMDLSSATMAGVAEELGKTPIPFTLPPDSPNLRMLQAIGTPEQKVKYLQPYIEGKLTSAIAISEPGAGSDPAGMRTTAVQTNDGWILNGRKIWISAAKTADFAIVMARVGDGTRREGISSFIVERGTPGYIIEREIPMLGGSNTYEILFENCALPNIALLGKVGQGYEPMQLRLRTRRLEMSATAVGMTQRALDILVDHANQRTTFGAKLSDRQAIQWWVADVATRLHACRLMILDAAVKVDRDEGVSQEISMIKVFATELAYEALDHAMQTLGALGMTQETVLFPFWQRARLMRIYEGPSEVHRQAIAKRVLSSR